MTVIQFRRHLYILLFLSLALLIGCGDKGVRLDGLVLDQNSGVASLTTGDGGTCTSAPCAPGTIWNDSFITPTASNSFTVAIKSAALIKQGDSAPSYIIFDSGDIANPTIKSFLPGTTQTLGANPDAPPDGTIYDKIQYVVTYYEMLVPINYQNTGSVQHRVRLYLASFNDPNLGSVVQNDILMDDTSGALNWIDPNSGLGNFLFPRPSGGSVLQLPSTQLVNAGTGGGTIDGPTDPYTFTITLASPVTASSDNQSVIQLNFDTTKIFFFDSTNRNSSGDDPNSNNNFKPPLVANCTTNGSGFTNEACDGRLTANPKAFFWPGLPAVTAEHK